MERLERGDTEGLEGIALRRTNGEVTAIRNSKLWIFLIREISIKL